MPGRGVSRPFPDDGDAIRRQVEAGYLAVQPVKRVVQPAELELPLLRLEQRPREHADRGGVHAGAAHQLVILGPSRGVPLLGVVVPAEPEAVAAPVDAYSRNQSSRTGPCRTRHTSSVPGGKVTGTESSVHAYRPPVHGTETPAR